MWSYFRQAINEINELVYRYILYAYYIRYNYGFNVLTLQWSNLPVIFKKIFPHIQLIVLLKCYINRLSDMNYCKNILKKCQVQSCFFCFMKNWKTKHSAIIYTIFYSLFIKGLWQRLLKEKFRFSKVSCCNGGLW